MDDVEERYEQLVRQLPGDRYWTLLVSNFAASGALSTGDLSRAERVARRGLAGDPEGIFAFWHMAGRCYLGATLALQGDLDQGLPLLDEAWGRYTAIGLRTNGVTLLASRTQALAQAGRLEAAAESLADAQKELATYQERYAEPVLLLAEAVLRHARAEDAAAVRDILLRSAELATAQGGQAIATRVRRTASELGYDL